MSADQQRAKGPVGAIFSLVGSGISLAAEYREHRRQQQQLSQHPPNRRGLVQPGLSNESLTQQRTSDLEILDMPPPYTKSQGCTPCHTQVWDSEGSRDEMEANERCCYSTCGTIDRVPASHGVVAETWPLDEAQGDMTAVPPTYGNKQGPAASVQDVRHHRTATTQPHLADQRLELPVIIPQRRPGCKRRGFVRAYAPILANHGIDQETFLRFLKSFHESTQASPVFPVLQVSAAIASLAPSVIAFAVCTTVQLGAQFGQEMQTRHRSNEFLDRMNESLFRSRGLYALVMQYRPDDGPMVASSEFPALEQEQAEAFDLSTSTAIARDTGTHAEGAERTFSTRMRQFRAASGTTEGSRSLPQAAPLIFPDTDPCSPREADKSKVKVRVKETKKFFDEYMDRRAHVKYAASDPDSVLALPAKKLASRRMRHNGPRGMMFGAADLSFRTRDEANLRSVEGNRYRDLRAKVPSRQRHGEDKPLCSDDESQGVGQGGGRRSGGFISKLTTEDVLYLLIVNMPSEAELLEARQKLGQPV